MLILRRLLARIFNIFDKSVDTYRELFGEREDLRVLEVAYGFGVNTFNIIRSIESLKNMISVSVDMNPRAIFSGSKIYRTCLEEI